MTQARPTPQFSSGGGASILTLGKALEVFGQLAKSKALAAQLWGREGARRAGSPLVSSAPDLP